MKTACGHEVRLDFVHREKQNYLWLIAGATTAVVVFPVKRHLALLVSVNPFDSTVLLVLHLMPMAISVLRIDLDSLLPDIDDSAV